MSIWLLISLWSRNQNRSSKSIKNLSAKSPTGDPNCPPYVCEAKRVLRKIIGVTDGSKGGSSVAAESIASNEDGGGMRMVWMRMVWMRRRTKMLRRLRRG